MSSASSLRRKVSRTFCGLTLTLTTCLFAHAASVSYQYDNAGRLRSTSTDDGAAISSTEYKLDAAGNRVRVQTVASVRPSQPQITSLTAPYLQPVSVTWSASSANPPATIAGYQVYRRTSSQSTLTLVTTVGASPWSDSNVSPATTYYYAVAAVDSTGAVSTKSPEATVTTLAVDTTAPNAPANLSASATSSQVTLTWNVASDNAGGSGVANYRVYRNGQYLATVAASSSPSYVDSNIIPDSTYTYTVRARDVPGNESGDSNSYQITPPYTGTYISIVDFTYGPNVMPGHTSTYTCYEAFEAVSCVVASSGAYVLTAYYQLWLAPGYRISGNYLQVQSERYGVNP